jgi:NADPH-dependent 2,4-dienoyl-CoA reductase/sulfur reductase-like enzyme
MNKLLFLLIFFPYLSGHAQQKISVDICVYGATSGGVMAAYTAAKLGKKVILVTSEGQLGGLSSGGLGNTDIGNKIAITGLARDFYRRVGLHYGKPEQWIFEPHVAEDIFKAYVREASITVLFHQSLKELFKKGLLIQEIRTIPVDTGESHTAYVIQAKEYIDCSYEGDLMAMASVSFTIGRESNL